MVYSIINTYKDIYEYLLHQNTQESIQARKLVRIYQSKGENNENFKVSCFGDAKISHVLNEFKKY